MNPVVKRFLRGLAFAILSAVFVAIANYFQGNPIPGVDALFMSVITGALLAGDKWVRNRVATDE